MSDDIRADNYYDANPNAQPQAQIGLFARLMGVITSPTKTFEDVARAPKWFPALLAVLALSLPSTIAMWTLYDFDRLFDAQVDMALEQYPQLSREQAEAGKPFQAVMWKILPVVAIVMTFVMGAAMAGLFYVPVKIAGGEHTFAQAFSVVVHSFVVFVVQGWISIPVMLFAEDRYALDLNNLVQANLAPFLGDDPAPALLALASSLDLFSIWLVVVLSIGLGVVSKRPVASAATVGVLWFLFVAVKVGFAVLQGMMGG